MPALNDEVSSAVAPHSPARKNMYLPRRIKTPTPTQTLGIVEDYKLLKAQRLFWVGLLANFSQRLAEMDAKVNAANAERLTLIEKYEQAPSKLADCDRLIAALEKNHGLPSQP
jgi:hypothetical protein